MQFRQRAFLLGILAGLHDLRLHFCLICKHICGDARLGSIRSENETECCVLLWNFVGLLRWIHHRIRWLLTQKKVKTLQFPYRHFRRSTRCKQRWHWRIRRPKRNSWSFRRTWHPLHHLRHQNPRRWQIDPTQRRNLTLCSSQRSSRQVQEWRIQLHILQGRQWKIQDWFRRRKTERQEENWRRREC